MAENSPWTVHFSSMVSPLTPGQGEDLYPRRRTDLGELETGGGGPAGERNGERARVSTGKTGIGLIWSSKTTDLAMKNRDLAPEHKHGIESRKLCFFLFFTTKGEDT